MSTTIRVNEETRAHFAKLSVATGRPMTQLVQEAAVALERRLFFENLASRYMELRADREGWAAIEGERAAEDPALYDASQ